MTPDTTLRTAPTDTSIRLATFDRSDSEQLRVGIGSYKGFQFLTLRVWNRSTDGQWWPDKTKGCTVRVRELREFRAAIEDACTRLGVTEREA